MFKFFNLDSLSIAHLYGVLTRKGIKKRNRCTLFFIINFMATCDIIKSYFEAL